MLKSILLCVFTGVIVSGLGPAIDAAEPPVERRFVNQVLPDFDPAKATQEVVSAHGLIRVESPSGWRLFPEKNRHKGDETKQLKKTSPNAALDFLVVYFYHPDAQLHCESQASVWPPQTENVTGFGSKHGIRLSPAAHYRIMRRNMEMFVEVGVREYGQFTRFETDHDNSRAQPDLVHAVWQWQSESGEVSEGLGETNLRDSAIISTFCNWPKGKTRHDAGAELVAQLRGAIAITPPVQTD